jgi:hypothetical protein
MRTQWVRLQNLASLFSLNPRQRKFPFPEFQINFGLIRFLLLIF